MNAFGQDFPPTDEAWQTRLAALQPAEYARTRNHLRGAVSYLSPYLTHGFLSLQQAVEGVRDQHPLRPDDKLYLEFDQAVGTLYATGYLHNHARMWLASYVVHLRHVHWRAGADWMYGHLLDGDLASNHLSWQWVASTFSSKPYLFNAENVAKYAPAVWHCTGTPLDTSYEHLDLMARGADEPGRRRFESMAQHAERHALAQTEPRLTASCPAAVPLREGDPPAALARAQAVSGVELVHPWALSSRSQPGVLRVGLLYLAEHARRPWSERRWRFVAERMQTICDVVWAGEISALLEQLPQRVALSADSSLQCLQTQAQFNRARIRWTSKSPMLTEPDRLCRSFSQFIRAVQPAAPSALNPSIR